MAKRTYLYRTHFPHCHHQSHPGKTRETCGKVHETGDYRAPTAHHTPSGCRGRPHRLCCRHWLLSCEERNRGRASVRDESGQGLREAIVVRVGDVISTIVVEVGALDRIGATIPAALVPRGRVFVVSDEQ